MSPDELENMLVESGLKQALEGNYQFYKDVMDRVHGPSQQKSGGETNNVQINILVDKMNQLLP